MLAIVWVTKYFRPFPFGGPLNVISDHKPLEWLPCWSIKLEYEHKIIYKKDKLNTKTDAFSDFYSEKAYVPKKLKYSTKVKAVFRFIPNQNQTSDSEFVKNIQNIIYNQEELHDMDNFFIQEQLGDENNENQEDNITIHSTSSCSKLRTNQIIIKSVLNSPANSKTFTFSSKRKGEFIYKSRRTFIFRR